MKKTDRKPIDWTEVRRRQREEDLMTPRLQAIPGWEAEVADIAADLGVTTAAIMEGFRQYDARAAAGGIFSAPMPLPTTIERTFPDGRTKEYMVEADVQEMVEHVLLWMAPHPAKAKAKRPRRTKEAARKRKARAEGRVKPRPKKGPPSLEVRIAAAEKSLATRRAKLVALKADLSQHPAEAMRCEAGIARTEKGLATFRAQLKSSAK